MYVWDVLSRTRPGAEWVVDGAVKAPDVEMAMLLARESFFRRGDVEGYAVRRRGHATIHECSDPTGIGGVTDRSYRRSDGYVGVGAKLKQVHQQMAARGLVVDRPRPPARRTPAEPAHA